MPARDSGKQFLDQVLAKIPEAQRAAVQQALETDDLLGFMGEQVLLRPEFSRQMDALVAKRAELDQWFQGQKGLLTAGANALARLKALKRRGVALSGDDEGQGGEPDDQDDQDDSDLGGEGISGRRRTRLPDNLVTKDDLAALTTSQQQLERQGIQLMSALNKLSMSHFKEFSEPLDTDALIESATKSGRSVADEYGVMVASRRETAAKQKHEEEIKAAEARGKAAAVAEISNQSMPYPVSVSEPGTGALSLLRSEKPNDGLSTVERAAREWNLARRTGTPLGGSGTKG